MHCSYVRSFVVLIQIIDNNSKPKGWHFQQDLHNIAGLTTDHLASKILTGIKIAHTPTICVEQLCLHLKMEITFNTRAI